MAKKLKKKIEETCGLLGLDYSDRRSKAEDILASKDWKQQLCNDLVGLSFRELEKVLNGIISEREVRNDDAYDAKLRTYKVYRESSKRPSESSDGPRQNTKPVRAPSRTLEQILAQVRAPRVEVCPKETFGGYNRLRNPSGQASLHEGSCDDDVETE